MTNYTNYSNVAVDGIISSSSQGLMMGTVTTMPTATAARDGCVVYYIGADTGTYTQDTWYRCKESDTPGTYEWEELDIGSGATYRNAMAQVTLTVAGWSNNSQTVAVSGLRATDIVVSSPVPAQLDAYQLAGITQTANSTNSVTFTCDIVPSVDIVVNVAMISTTPTLDPGIIIDSAPTQGSTNLVTSGGVYTAVAAKQDTLSSTQLDAVNSGINSTKVTAYDGYATTIAGKMDSSDFHTVGGVYGSDNPVTTQSFVNSSISTNTATYQGNYTITDLSIQGAPLTVNSSNADVATALGEVSGLDPDNNDYCFVYVPAHNDQQVPPQAVPSRYDRYKYSDGTPGSWAYEYTLNNSGFTAVQWEAINSGINTTKVSAYDAYATSKQDTLVAGTNMDTAPTQDSTHPVTSGGVYSAINTLAVLKGTAQSPISDSKYGDLYLRNGELWFMNSDLTQGTPPSQNTWSKSLRLCDKDGLNYGYLSASIQSDGYVSTVINANDGTNSQSMGISSAGFAYCPNPPSGDNSTKIATTNWVANYITNMTLNASHTGTVSIANSTEVSTTYIDITVPGLYLIIIDATILSGADILMAVGWRASGGGPNWLQNQYMPVADTARANACIMVSFSAQTRIYGTIYQRNGVTETLTANYTFQAIRVA